MMPVQYFHRISVIGWFSGENLILNQEQAVLQIRTQFDLKHIVQAFTLFIPYLLGKMKFVTNQMLVKFGLSTIITYTILLQIALVLAAKDLVLLPIKC